VELGGGERRSQVADLKLRLLQVHSAHVEEELSALCRGAIESGVNIEMG